MKRRMSRKLCPNFQRAVDLLCKRWTALIIDALAQAPFRFNELLAQLEIVSDRMLSERLKELESAGIVERRVLPQTPIRVEYRLTARGQALEPTLSALRSWSHAHLGDENGHVQSATTPSAIPQVIPVPSTAQALTNKIAL